MVSNTFHATKMSRCRVNTHCRVYIIQLLCTMYQNSISYFEVILYILCVVFLLQYLSIVLIKISAVSLFISKWNEKEIKSAQMCHQHINNFIILSCGIDVRVIKLSKYWWKFPIKTNVENQIKYFKAIIFVWCASVCGVGRCN